MSQKYQNKTDIISPFNQIDINNFSNTSCQNGTARNIKNKNETDVPLFMCYDFDLHNDSEICKNNPFVNFNCSCKSNS